MRLDLRRHELLKILSGRMILGESEELPEKEPLGTSYEDLTELMKCNRLKLSEISSELYKNKEVCYHDANGVKGLACGKYGLSAYSNNKYKQRHKKDVLSFWLTVSQILVPILALVVAIIAVGLSIDSQANRIEILKLKNRVEKLEILNSQPDKTQNYNVTILETDSLDKI